MGRQYSANIKILYVVNIYKDLASEQILTQV